MDDPLELDWEELGPLLRVGDEMARKIVIDKLWPRLCRRACSIVGERNTAEDVVQQALLYSLAGIERGDEITNWEGYFLNMVGKEARKARARNKHGKNVSLYTAGSGDEDDAGSWASTFPSDREPTPLTNLLNDELRQTIELFVEELDCKLASVVRLRLLKEKKFEEIARILEVPLATTCTRYHRGLRQLRKKLEESEYV